MHDVMIFLHRPPAIRQICQLFFYLTSLSDDVLVVTNLTKKSAILAVPPPLPTPLLSLLSEIITGKWSPATTAQYCQSV